MLSAPRTVFQGLCRRAAAEAAQCLCPGLPAPLAEGALPSAAWSGRAAGTAPQRGHSPHLAGPQQCPEACAGRQERGAGWHHRPSADKRAGVARNRCKCELLPWSPPAQHPNAPARSAAPSRDGHKLVGKELLSQSPAKCPHVDMAQKWLLCEATGGAAGRDRTCRRAARCRAAALLGTALSTCCGAALLRYAWRAALLPCSAVTDAVLLARVSLYAIHKLFLRSSCPCEWWVPFSHCL